jgi:hypothetical protein
MEVDLALIIVILASQTQTKIKVSKHTQHKRSIDKVGRWEEEE